MPTKPSIGERVDKHDREIAAIRKLIATGMKLVVEVQRAQKKTALAQAKTEQTLERFIQLLRGETNGHGKKPGANGHSKKSVH